MTQLDKKPTYKYDLSIDPLTVFVVELIQNLDRTGVKEPWNKVGLLKWGQHKIPLQYSQRVKDTLMINDHLQNLTNIILVNHLLYA